MKLIVEELVRYLNIDKLVPSYKLSVTVSCLKAMRNLQRNGHIPNDPTLFKSYCSEHQFVDVRLAAIESLIDFTRDDANSYILSFLLDIIENGTQSSTLSLSIEMKRAVILRYIRLTDYVMMKGSSFDSLIAITTFNCRSSCFYA